MTTPGDWYFVLVQVHTREPVAPGHDYAEWMNNLRRVINAGCVSFSTDRPWTVGDHRRWVKDWTGHMSRKDEPYANVWQQITGVGSCAMAYVWAAIHLVQPLEDAGYIIDEVYAQRTDEMVITG